jgi:spore germination protein GerM
MRAVAVVVALLTVLTAGCGSGRTTVPAAGGERAAVEALLAGPADASLGTEVPTATRLLDVRVADRIATVDLSRDFESGGGSLSMRMRIAQVVYTLTELDGVGRVRFELDGEPVEAVGGEGVLVAAPLGRADFADLEQ